MEILIAIIVILILFVIIQYNAFINLKKKVEQAKSTIDVYLKQRFDLIPNLVECIKGYAKYEKETLSKVIEMRNNYLSSLTKDLDEGAKLNDECNKIVLLSEKYPDLKANEEFLNLQKNLSKIESQLQAARRIYNIEVVNYNTKVSTVPSNIIANIFNFKEESLFTITESERSNVNVDIDN